MIFYGHPHLMYGAHFYLQLDCQGFRDLEQPHLTAPARSLLHICIRASYQSALTKPHETNGK